MLNSKIYFLAAALVTLAACGNDNEMGNAATNGELVPMQVTGSINAAKTRVTADSEWETNDEIGIYGTSGDLEYKNVPYKYNDQDAFEPMSQTLYFGASIGKFTAYYPYNEHDNAIVKNIEDQEKTLDFLYAKEIEVNKENPKAAFKFEHKMSLLTLHMIAGTGFANDDFSEKENFQVKLSSVSSSVAFDITTGEVVPRGNKSIQFRPFSYPETVNNETSYYFSIILCPETIQGGITFTFTKDNVPYTATLTTDDDKTKMEMKPGKVYEYDVTVSKTEMMIPSDVTIKAWEKAWEGRIEVDATV